jgi:hypothetical protein
MLAVAHRSKMRSAASQSLFASIQAAREQVAPQAHAAFAATEETRIAFARVFGCAGEASHQAAVCTVESTSHVRIPHSELPQRAQGFLAEDVAGGCRCDALPCEQNNAPGTFGGKSGECATVGPGQSLAPGDPPCGLTAFGRRERAAVKVRGIDGVNGLGKTGLVDQHAELHPKKREQITIGRVTAENNSVSTLARLFDCASGAPSHIIHRFHPSFDGATPFLNEQRRT